MTDATRYPEPADRPEPHAQWDEIRGVWEVWNDTAQAWDEIGPPLDAQAGVPDASPVPVAGVLSSHEREVDHIEREGVILGVGGDVAKTFIQAEALERIEEEGRERLDEIADAPLHSDGVRYPEPDVRPDPHAQWDEHEGVWMVWNPSAGAWAPWSSG